MNFHLSFPITSFDKKITYAQKSLFIGSCFAENIGDLMQYYKFDTLINPHGIVYNPLSIATSLRKYIDNKGLHEDDLFYANECWNSWEHHSSYSNVDKQACLETINSTIAAAHLQLKKADWLFLTFGSAYVYKQKATNEIVSNCHKIPNNQFTKELLSISEIVDEYKQLIAHLAQFNPQLKIVFTVSPVRYIRDGVVENNRSKARLIEAVHELVASTNNSIYFPAYELVIDDLRDYRFYKADLVHPNEQAIDYVFEHLIHKAFSDETKLVLEKVKSIISAVKHKPFNESTEAHKKFKSSFLEKCLLLQNTHPSVDLKAEIDFFKS